MDTADAAKRQMSENDDPLSLCLSLSLGDIYSNAPPPAPSLSEMSLFLPPPPPNPLLALHLQPSAGVPTLPHPELAPLQSAFHALPAGLQLSAPPPPQGAPVRAARRRQGNPNRGGKAASAGPPPFPWATEQRAVVHSLEYLRRHGITRIEGQAQCRRCETSKVIGYDLEAKFAEVAAYIMANRHDMDDRAPMAWTNPVFPDCGDCGQRNCMRPVIPADKAGINWLFLLLGQTLGCCTLEQLKYFCMHTKNHRTGAKDRVLYYTYLALCKQLCPDGPFDLSLGNGSRLVQH